MKTKVLTILNLLLITTLVKAQEYKLAKSSGSLVLNEINNVTVEGYDGNEIIFSSEGAGREKDERAQGLHAINSSGLEDNTGFGFSVVTNGDKIQVYQLRKMDGDKLKIMVPKKISIEHAHTTPHGSIILLKNLANEISVSTVHQSIKLENVTGPVVLETIHGKIEVVFGNDIKTPVNILSVHGLIDVTIPAATKADVAMRSSRGQVFVAPELKFELTPRDDKMVVYDSDVLGKINGGGNLLITLASTHGNIYLRKK